MIAVQKRPSAVKAAAQPLPQPLAPPPPAPSPDVWNDLWVPIVSRTALAHQQTAARSSARSSDAGQIINVIAIWRRHQRCFVSVPVGGVRCRTKSLPAHTPVAG
jgi:hypothetical protein